MFKNYIEYQQAYFTQLYDVTSVDFGYFTQSADGDYINANSITVTEVTDDFVASVCSLLATNIHTTKLQLPTGIIEYGDERDNLSLIKYQNIGRELDNQVTIELVTIDNYSQFTELSNQLQTQEYGTPYKVNTNNQYLDQSKYQMYIICYKHEYIGEFTYIPSLSSVESIILLKDYQRRGIMTNCLELITTKLSSQIYLSADNSSIGFYQKIDCQIIDQYPVVNLYGNSRNILMYLSLCI